MADDGGAVVLDQPLAMLGHDAVVDAKIGVELRECRGHDALPLNAHNRGCIVGLEDWDAITEWIGRIENVGGLAIHPGPAGDARNDSALGKLGDAALENGVENAGLTPDLAGAEFPVGMKTSEFGTGAGAARRAIIGFAGAENEVPAIRQVRIAGRAEVFDVVDFHALIARDPLLAERSRTRQVN